MSLTAVCRNEKQFISGENLRYAPHSCKHSHSQLEFARVFAYAVSKAVHIVVAEENQHIVNVLIHKVVRQELIYPGHSATPAGAFIQPHTDGIVQREVHNCREVGVEAVAVRIVLLPICELRDGGGPALAHNVEMRIFVGYSLAPAGHRFLFVVRIGVHPEAVQTEFLNPPHSPLYEIVEYEWIVQVHIRHRRHEPAAFLNVEVVLGSVGVHICREADVGVGVFRENVYPILERQVLHPPVGGSAVVGDYVHYDLEAFAVGCLHIFGIFFIVTETGVDVVVVGAGIAVI